MFLGRSLVEAATRQGHELTLFNRGRSAPSPIPEVEQLRGERRSDLSALEGRRWDAVIDTSGFVPHAVRNSARLLADAVEHYTFVSSISVYDNFDRPGLTEDAPLSQLADPESEDVERYYAEFKAACEQEVQAVFDGRSLIIRPGLIVGPHDPTERFTYWVRRLASDGAVIAPRAAEQPVQFIDVRDLADWMIEMVEREATGAFNATGPAQPLTFVDMLDRMHAAIGSGSELVWVTEEELVDAGVEPWEELPLWLDLPRHPEYAGFLDVDVSRALVRGLELRDIERTTVDTLAWTRRVPAPAIKRFDEEVPAPGLTPEREQQLLTQLRS